MAIVIEAEVVVLRNATVHHRSPGGMEEFLRHCPNRSFCTDGTICRVGFMTREDAFQYIGVLGRLGYAPPGPGGSPEVALISAGAGPVFPCDWLELGRGESRSGHPVTIAWLRGTQPSSFVAPPGWRPGIIFAAPIEDILKEYEFAGVTHGVEAYRHRKTGKMVYRAEPGKGSRKRWWEFWK